MGYYFFFLSEMVIYEVKYVNFKGSPLYKAWLSIFPLLHEVDSSQCRFYVYLYFIFHWSEDWSEDKKVCANNLCFIVCTCMLLFDIFHMVMVDTVPVFM